MSHAIALIINFGLLLPPAYGVAKIMFSVVSVHQSRHSVHGVGGVTRGPYHTGPYPTVLTHCAETIHSPLNMFKLAHVGPHCKGTHPPNMFTLAHM